MPAAGAGAGGGGGAAAGGGGGAATELAALTAPPHPLEDTAGALAAIFSAYLSENNMSCSQNPAMVCQNIAQSQNPAVQSDPTVGAGGVRTTRTAGSSSRFGSEKEKKRVGGLGAHATTPTTTMPVVMGFRHARNFCLSS